jgi:hypothetical protein
MLKYVQNTRCCKHFGTPGVALSHGSGTSQITSGCAQVASFHKLKIKIILKTTSLFFSLDNGPINRPKYRYNEIKENCHSVFISTFLLCCINFFTLC